MKIKNAIIILFAIALLVPLISVADPDPPEGTQPPYTGPAPDFDGTLTVNFEGVTTVNVGDTVVLNVVAYNSGLSDWTCLAIYAPVPEGLQYVTHDMPDRVVKDYDPDTGIWSVYQMRAINRGMMKNMVVTYKVLPSASGKTITAKAKIYTLLWRGYNMANRLPTAYTTLTVNPLPEPEPEPPENETNNTDPGDGGGLGGGQGGGIGNGTGIGNQNATNYGNALFAKAVENMTASNKKDPLLNSRDGGGGNNGKKYEVMEDLKKTDSRYVYVLAALLIIGLIIVGYYYGIRGED